MWEGKRFSGPLVDESSLRLYWYSRQAGEAVVTELDSKTVAKLKAGIQDGAGVKNCLELTDLPASIGAAARDAAFAATATHAREHGGQLSPHNNVDRRTPQLADEYVRSYGGIPTPGARTLNVSPAEFSKNMARLGAYMRKHGIDHINMPGSLEALIGRSDARGSLVYAAIEAAAIS